VIQDGAAQLGDAPGIGVEPDIARLQKLCEVAR
jgi:L-alanine-DL-glutamate epimerase-like enolase superfamily enzyme